MKNKSMGHCFSDTESVSLSFKPRSSVCSSPGFGGTSGMVYDLGRRKKTLFMLYIQSTWI